MAISNWLVGTIILGMCHDAGVLTKPALSTFFYPAAVMSVRVSYGVQDNHFKKRFFFFY